MISLFNTYVSPRAADHVSKVLGTALLSEGVINAEFENQLKMRLGINHLATLNSGTSALHLALVLAGVKSGDEVILPAQTFIASGLAVKYCQANPVFADIQYSTGNVCPSSLRQKITSKTRAIMVVHWAGLPCDMAEIKSIAQEFQLPIIEDAAHALGATYQGMPIGNISDFTCFSFQAIKHLTTGDGGAISFSKVESLNQAKKLRWFGIDRQRTALSELGERIYDADEVGYKYHLNDYAAALGLANIETLSARLERVGAIAQRYRAELDHMSGLTLWHSPKDRVSANWLFGMHVENRLDFIRNLKSKGISASVVHQRIDRNGVFGKLREDLPNQTRFDETQIHIPLHFGLSDEQVDSIIFAIKAGW